MSDTIEGFGDLEAALKALAAVAQPDDLQSAGKAGADVLLSGMRRRVPVDTGELHDSLEVAVQARESGEVTIAVRSNVEHAEPVERGTRRQHAQPYMRPAVDEDGDAAIEAVATVLRTKIERVAP